MADPIFMQTADHQTAFAFAAGPYGGTGVEFHRDGDRWVKTQNLNMQGYEEKDGHIRITCVIDNKTVRIDNLDGSAAVASVDGKDDPKTFGKRHNLAEIPAGDPGLDSLKRAFERIRMGDGSLGTKTKQVAAATPRRAGPSASA